MGSKRVKMSQISLKWAQIEQNWVQMVPNSGLKWVQSPKKVIMGPSGTKRGTNGPNWIQIDYKMGSNGHNMGSNIEKFCE